MKLVIRLFGQVCLPNNLCSDNACSRSKYAEKIFGKPKFEISKTPRRERERERDFELTTTNMFEFQTPNDN